MNVVNELLSKVPEKLRYDIYFVASLGLLGYAAFTAADGDWKKALGIFIGSLVGATAATNTGRTGFTKV